MSYPIILPQCSWHHRIMSCQSWWQAVQWYTDSAKISVSSAATAIDAMFVCNLQCHTSSDCISIICSLTYCKANVYQMLRQQFYKLLLFWHIGQNELSIRHYNRIQSQVHVRCNTTCLASATAVFMVLRGSTTVVSIKKQQLLWCWSFHKVLLQLHYLCNCPWHSV